MIDGLVQRHAGVDIGPFCQGSPLVAIDVQQAVEHRRGEIERTFRLRSPECLPGPGQYAVGRLGVLLAGLRMLRIIAGSGTDD